MRGDAKIGIRVLFGGTLIFFIFQMVLIYIMKAEPYPALTAPAFDGHPNSTGVVERNEAVIEVRFTDGHTQTVQFKHILPPTTGVALGHVIDNKFSDDSFLSEPETVAWLRSRVSALFPMQQSSGVDIIWRTAHYNINTDVPTVYSPVRTIHVEFDGKE